MSGFELGLDSVSGTIANTTSGNKLQRGTAEEELSLELSSTAKLTKVSTRLFAVLACAPLP